MTRRAALRLSHDCDNACVFCAQAGIEDALELDRALDREGAVDALAALRREHEEITFVGGEPALHPQLPDLVAEARERGFSAIGLQTNGRRLAEDAELFARLVEAGLSDLHLSIHAPGSASHDYHTGRPGSFDALMDLITRAQRAGVTMVVTTVITRSNFRELPRMPPALKRRGIAAWLLEMVRPYGRGAEGFARVVPRFGMALPWALHALELARRNDLSAWIRGAPLCALGPFAASSLPDEPRSYAEACRDCPSRPRCPGVDSAYLEVFDHKELIPKQTAPPASFDEGRACLIRMFVGVGPLVERPPVLYHRPRPEGPPAEMKAADEPEAGKHRRLPVLASDPAEQAQSNTDPEPGSSGEPPASS